jgi:DNA repair exonuclease SbcCD ATPase subunit
MNYDNDPPPHNQEANEWRQVSRDWRIRAESAEASVHALRDRLAEAERQLEDSQHAGDLVAAERDEAYRRERTAKECLTAELDQLRRAWALRELECIKSSVALVTDLNKLPESVAALVRAGGGT